jgi:hypothetical protein
VARVLTARGEQWRSWLPVVVRDSPDHLAVIHACAVEMERLEAAIEQVRQQAFPQHADVLLKVWEFMLRITIEPVGVSLADRRLVVLATLRKMRSTPEGRDWVDNVTALVGPGWTYEEHDPHDAGSPPPYTVRISLPFAPSSSAYARAETLIRDITPAHLDLILAFPGGFLLDESQLDQEAVQ